MSNRLRIFSVMWETDTAGPSPEGNMRTEIFLKGCNKAMEGNPCPGCFNSDLWDLKAQRTYTPQEAFFNMRYAPNKYVTISGGEPTDQIDALIEFCRLLKEDGFHIMVYTWRGLQKEILEKTDMSYKLLELLNYIDILVDGEYVASERIYDEERGDGFLSSIGSANQIVWDVREYNKTKDRLMGYKAGDIFGLYVKNDGDLVYVVFDDEVQPVEIELNREVVCNG